MSSSQTTSQQGHEHPDHVKVSFGIPAPVIVTLAALTAIAPLGIDMYLASLPTVARELNTTDAAALYDSQRLHDRHGTRAAYDRPTLR